jgi:hypothetical protein
MHGVGRAVDATLRPLYPRKEARYALKEAEWTPGPVWTYTEKRKHLAYSGDQTQERPACCKSLYRLYRSIPDLCRGLLPGATSESITCCNWSVSALIVAPYGTVQTGKHTMMSVACLPPLIFIFQICISYSGSGFKAASDVRTAWSDSLYIWLAFSHLIRLVIIQPVI